jgi:hypothetical protein
MDEQEKLSRARQKVEAMTGFYIHLAAFAAVNALLFIINVVSGEGWWVQWAFFGWGIGVIAHALAVFGRLPNFVANWQVRKIRELKDHM